jgi:hypothetical protein
MQHLHQTIGVAPSPCSRKAYIGQRFRDRHGQRTGLCQRSSRIPQALSHQCKNPRGQLRVKRCIADSEKSPIKPNVVMRSIGAPCSASLNQHAKRRTWSSSTPVPLEIRPDFLAAYGDETRCVWLADSFAGVPRRQPQTNPAHRMQPPRHTPHATRSPRMPAAYCLNAMLGLAMLQHWWSCIPIIVSTSGRPTRPKSRGDGEPSRRPRG